MAIPYYSMPVNSKEIGLAFKSLISGRAFNGPAINKYQTMLSEILGVDHIIPFPSGRTGYYFLQEALFNPGDEIICSIFSFPLFIRLMHEKSIKPVFVDIEMETGCIDPMKIEENITQKTKGILITHLFGNACEMEKIVDICRENKIYLIEDCAHAYMSNYKGQPVGTFGDAAVFSTSPMKVPTTLGGGFVATKDSKISDKLYRLLDASGKYQYHFKNLLKLFTLSMVYYINSHPLLFSILTSRFFLYMKAKNPGALRNLFYSDLISKKQFDPFERLKFSNLQALVGISQVQRHDNLTMTRRHYARIYDAAFQDYSNIIPVRGSNKNFNNYLYYIIQFDGDTDRLIDMAMDRGLFLMREECWHCEQYPFASDYRQDCPNADELKPKLVRLPNSSMLTEDKINHAADIVVNIAKELE